MSRLADRFILEREIGAGGMSVVYLGRDEVLDRPVAVKVLRSTHMGSDVGKRFSREGRTAARISHPNVVQVYDAGLAELDGEEVPYIVMEHVPGGDLMDLLDREGSLSGERLAFLGEVASGLAFAHEAGIVHRDIKPHNILIDDHGRAKLTDFGIAKALDATQATQTGFYLGTALYSSPEQLQGHGAGPESDIYSLGATLYHAAVGGPPFTGTPIEVASQHVTQTPAPPTERGARLDEATEEAIMACLAKDPAKRPSAEEVRRALSSARAPVQAPAERSPETAATRVQTAPPPRRPAPEQTAPSARASGAPVRRRSWGPILAAVALLALLGLGAALAAPTLLGDGESGQGSGGGAAQRDDGGSSGAGSSGEQAQAGSSNGSSENASSGSGDSSGNAGGGNAEGGSEENGLTSEAASQTVQELYATAEAGEYGASYEMLSQGFRQSQAPTEADWSNQFETLQSIEFIEGPSASVSGDTATVEGVTLAEHTDRTEENTVTWTLVNEDGEWKLEGISVQNQQIV